MHIFYGNRIKWFNYPLNLTGWIATFHLAYWERRGKRFHEMKLHTWVLNDLMTEMSSLSPTIFLTCCTSSFLEIFFSWIRSSTMWDLTILEIEHLPNACSNNKSDSITYSVISMILDNQLGSSRRQELWECGNESRKWHPGWIWPSRGFWNSKVSCTIKQPET